MRKFLSVCLATALSANVILSIPAMAITQDTANTHKLTSIGTGIVYNYDAWYGAVREQNAPFVHSDFDSANKKSVNEVKNDKAAMENVNTIVNTAYCIEAPFTVPMYKMGAKTWTPGNDGNKANLDMGEAQGFMKDFIQNHGATLQPNQYFAFSADIRTEKGKTLQVAPNLKIGDWRRGMTTQQNPKDEHLTVTVGDTWTTVGADANGDLMPMYYTNADVQNALWKNSAKTNAKGVSFQFFNCNDSEAYLQVKNFSLYLVTIPQPYVPSPSKFGNKYLANEIPFPGNEPYYGYNSFAGTVMDLNEPFTQNSYLPAIGYDNMSASQKLNPLQMSSGKTTSQGLFTAVSFSMPAPQYGWTFGNDGENKFIAGGAATSPLDGFNVLYPNGLPKGSYLAITADVRTESGKTTKLAPILKLKDWTRPLVGVDSKDKAFTVTDKWTTIGIDSSNNLIPFNFTEKEINEHVFFNSSTGRYEYKGGDIRFFNCSDTSANVQMKNLKLYVVDDPTIAPGAVVPPVNTDPDANLFVGATGKANSQNASYPISNALDGVRDIDNRWVTTPHSQNPLIATITTAASSTVESIKVVERYYGEANERGRIDKFTVTAITPTGARIVVNDLAATDRAIGTTTVHVLNFTAPVNARRFEIKMVTDTQAYNEGANIVEIEAYSHLSQPESNTGAKVDRTAVWTGDPNFYPGKYWGNTQTSPFRDGEGEVLTYGMWCWNTDLFMPNAADNEANLDMNKLLDMCIMNKFNELYLSLLGKVQTADSIDAVGASQYKYSEMELRGFIKKCSQYGIKVFALEGDGGEAALEWMNPNNNRTQTLINTIAKINANAKADDEKIAGLHLDLEAPLNYNDDINNPISKQRYQDSIDYFVRSRAQCDAAGISLQFDNNAWTREDVMVNFKGQRVPYLDALTQTIENLTLMAYRDTASAQWDQGAVANNSNEVKFGAKNGCNILVGAELSLVYQMAPGEWFITYDNRNGAYYASEMAKLRDIMLNYRKTSQDPGARTARLGTAAHHSTAFWLLMNKPNDGPADFNQWQIDSGRWPWPPQN
ncbi:MAG: hypothetical protein RR497_03025 [Oscillospiraceae bacterium]